MKPTAHRIKKVVLTAGVLVIALAVYELPVLRFHGNAWIWGGPGLGYRIRMGAIPFNHAGQYTFHLRGIPDGDMSLLLYAQGKTGNDRAELTNLHTTLQAVLVDQKGEVICQASASPGNGPIDQIWALMSAYWGTAFWHSNCLHMPLNHSASYTFTFRVRDVDPKTPRMNLLPVLESDHRVWP